MNPEKSTTETPSTETSVSLNHLILTTLSVITVFMTATASLSLPKGFLLLVLITTIAKLAQTSYPSGQKSLQKLIDTNSASAVAFGMIWLTCLFVKDILAVEIMTVAIVGGLVSYFVIKDYRESPSKALRFFVGVFLTLILLSLIT